MHEIAHGWVAGKLGDPTATRLGRITLNPIPHIDPVMTLLVPAMLIMSGSPIVFGGAKPVPVDPRFFTNPKKDMMLVSIAGPATNIALAIICY
jgi:Zn-dependent protease